jgi:hypothetical protein
MLRFFALVALLLGSATTHAELDSQLQYSSIQLNYYTLNPDDDINGHGKGIDASIRFGKRKPYPYYVVIRFRDPDNSYAEAKDDVDERSLWGGEAGLGHYRAITDTLHWSVAALFHNREKATDGSFEDEGWAANDETGGGLHFGLRHLVIPAFEWGAELATVYVHGNEVHRFAYAQWHVTSAFSFGVKAIRMEDEQLYNGFFRVSF